MFMKFMKCLEENSLQYKTNKITVIRNSKVTYLLRILQLAIIYYIFIYSICYKRGYQNSYGLSSSLDLKMKGLGLANQIDRKIWDVADFVVPPQEENAIFITTNVIVTNQTQGKCAEKLTIANAICKSDSDCDKGKALHLGNGMMTGKCINATNTTKTCEIHAWCPLEQNDDVSSQQSLIKEISEYTLLIKNTVIFDKINVQRSNLFGWTNGQSCIFDAKDNLLKYCPKFNVSSFIGEMNQTDLTELLAHGGLIRVMITWDCNLDTSHDLCRPEYTFDKLLTTFGNDKGWNFRYANYFYRDEKEYRKLFKVYGMRILIEVRGMAYKFDWFTCFMNIGSGIGLLGIATFVCNKFMIWCGPQKKEYYNMIHEEHDIKVSENANSILLKAET